MLYQVPGDTKTCTIVVAYVNNGRNYPVVIFLNSNQANRRLQLFHGLLLKTTGTTSCIITLALDLLSTILCKPFYHFHQNEHRSIIIIMDLTSSSGFAPTQYIFPILKHSDILQCMSELSIELSKAELAEPARHKDRIKRVFLQLVR